MLESVVEFIAVTSLEDEREIKVFIIQRTRKTVRKLWLGASQHHFIVAVDYAVAVLIDKLRVACLQILFVPGRYG